MVAAITDDSEDTPMPVQGSAWLVLYCYTAAMVYRVSRQGRTCFSSVREWWTLGWLSLIAHVIIALWFAHGGSWSAAYEHTARRTQEAIGWNWGGGVWFNLATVMIWGLDVIWMWIQPDSANRLAHRLDAAAQVYIAFMMFNATVVFGSWPARIVGGLICEGLAIIAVWARPPRSSTR